MLNKIIVMGRLTRDPELRRTQSGLSVTSFSVACDRDFKSQSGEKETDFIDIVAWRQTAEFVCKYFSKGRMAIVEGRLQIRDWQDNNGNKRRSAEIVADNVYFGDSKRDGDGGGYPQGGYAPQGGYSQQSTVAAAMTAKAGNINGLFRAKALIDIDCGASGARAYSDVLTKKNAANIADEDEIAFWPMAKLGDYKFHLSTQMAGLMAQIDTGNGGCPYESPSNKGLQCDGLCLEDGTEVNLTLAQANYLNGIGVDTALNFMSGWVAWGNYTACYPSNTDVKDYFIPVSRMFGWVGNSLVKTFWSKLDKPMTRRLIDTVLDSANIWLNGLVGMGYLLGARVEMLENENPLTNLMAGIIKLHVYMTPPSPAQEIDFVLEYDASYVTSALQG